MLLAVVWLPARAAAHHRGASAAAAPASCGGAADSSLTPAASSPASSTPRSRAATSCCRSWCPRGRRRCACATATTSPRRRPTRASGTCSTSASTRPARRPAHSGARTSSAAGAARAIPTSRCRRNGFSSEADYLANPKLHRQRQDDARLPARADPGRRVGGRARRGGGRLAGEGDADGKVAWRVEIDTSDDPAVGERSLPAGALRRVARPRRPGLVRGRLPRPRRALLARRRDHARGVRLRLRAAGTRLRRLLGAGRRPRLHHALRLRDRARRGGRSAASSPTIRASWSSAAPRSSPTRGTPTTTPA